MSVNKTRKSSGSNRARVTKKVEPSKKATVKEPKDEVMVDLTAPENIENPVVAEIVSKPRTGTLVKFKQDCSLIDKDGEHSYRKGQKVFLEGNIKETLKAYYTKLEG